MSASTTTPLHRALDIPASPFTMALVERAISDAVPESATLDWKRKLPTMPQGGAEFAKDVAAMANSGGGLIVFGVQEASGTSAAAELIPVEGWVEQNEHQLRMAARTHVRPPVEDLVFHLAHDPDGNPAIVAVDVPASPNAPHLWFSQKNNDAFRAPVRTGATTTYMDERAIERAYRDRAAATTVRDQLLVDRTAQILKHLSPTTRVAVLAAAIPHRPRPGHLPRPTRHEAEALFTKFRRRNPYSYSASYQLSFNARPGLRRWRAKGPDDVSPTTRVVELFDDGSIAFAHAPRPLSDGMGGEPGDLDARTVEALVAEVVWLTHLAAAELGIYGAYDLHLTLGTSIGPEWYRIRDFEEGSSYLQDPSLATLMSPFEPITLTFDPTDGAHQAVHDLATDVLNQAGIAHLTGTTIRPLDEPGLA